MRRLFLLAVCLICLVASPSTATEAGWALLRNGGQIVLLVHANAPGSGEPANFEIDNCRTQRNLSERGRQQARRIGALFAARAEPVGQVLASRYCRALDTARLAFGDRLLEPWEALDPLPADEAGAEKQVADIVARISDYSGSGNLVLVTHAPVVTAVSGARPREGEAVIVAPTENGLHVIGRIVFN